MEYELSIVMIYWLCFAQDQSIYREAEVRSQVVVIVVKRLFTEGSNVKTGLIT